MTMAFQKEQARVERLTALKLKQLDMDLARNEQEIAAMADNDPGLQAARAKRIQLMKQSKNLEQMMASLQNSMALAGNVRGDRLQEVDARLQSLQQGWATSAQAAGTAFQNGLNMALDQNAREGSFWDQAARISAAAMPGQIDPVTGEVSQGRDTFNSAVTIALDNVQGFFTGHYNPDLAKAKATEFERNGASMAAQVVHNAFQLNGDAFGLDKGNQTKGATLAVQIVSDAAALAQVGNGKMLPQSDGLRAEFKQRIAKNIGEMRGMGMRDEQISALFDGLESMHQNMPAILAKYDMNDPKAGVLKQSLTGIGSIHDAIMGVVNNGDLMQAAGGKLVDYTKYDWSGISKKAKLAYGMSDSPQLAQLQQELEAAQIPREQKLQIIKLVTESDPNLQWLRPEDFLSAIEGARYKSTDTEMEALQLGEDIQKKQAQMVAGGRASGLSRADARLAEIMGLTGG